MRSAAPETDFTGALDGVGIPSGMIMQIAYYLSESNYVADPNALYVLFGGGNDIRDAALLEPALRDNMATTAAINTTVGAYFLGQAGARRFLVLNAPDIGLTPEARLVRNNAAAATAATIQYNLALDYGLNWLSFPDMSLFRFDTFGLIHLIYQDALAGGPLTGFTNATMPCFAGSTGFDCSTSIFADDIHPTARIHEWLGYTAHATVPNPEPATFGLMAIALCALVWPVRRRNTAKNN